MMLVELLLIFFGSLIVVLKNLWNMEFCDIILEFEVKIGIMNLKFWDVKFQWCNLSSNKRREIDFLVFYVYLVDGMVG